MGKLFLILLAILAPVTAGAQQGFAYTRITTEDGIGLSSNVVTSLYQDEKGFIWTGTTNGLQRFDGSKFIQFSVNKPGSDKLPNASLSQIIGAEGGSLFLAFAAIREFGIFNPATLVYKKVPLKLHEDLPARAEFYLWKTAGGDQYLTVLGYGIIQYLCKT